MHRAKKRLFLLLSFSLAIFVLCKRAEAESATDTNAIRAIFVKAMDLQDQDPDAAYALAREAFLRSMKSDYKAGMGMGFMRFASILDAKGAYDSALFFYREALGIRILIRD